MPKAKSIFISAYLGLCALAAIAAAWMAAVHDGSWIWILALTLPVLYLSVGNLLLHHSATTSRWLPIPSLLAAIGTLAAILSSLAGTTSPWTGSTALALGLGYVAYLFWYSRFPARTDSRIRRGSPLPGFTARRLDGTTASSRELRGSPALLVFYRGNWCPLCSTQVRALARNYQELSKRGIRTILISPQSQEHTADLARRFDAPMEFWIDEGLAAARTLGIVDVGGIPAGMEILGYDSDTVLPTSILVDAEGVVFYDDQTDSYRIRPEPEDYLAAFDARASGSDSRREQP